MTPVEFKAWFEGFTEGMEGKPTEKQWARIKKRVSEIDGHAATREYVYRNWYPSYVGGASCLSQSVKVIPLNCNTMTDLGRHDYSADAA